MDLLIPGRRLIKKGPISVQNTKSHSVSKAYLILVSSATRFYDSIDSCLTNSVSNSTPKLNDVFIVCQDSKVKNSKLKVKKQVEVLGMSVSSDVYAFTAPPKKSADADDLNPNNGFAVFVPSIRKVFQLFAK